MAAALSVDTLGVLGSLAPSPTPGLHAVTMNGLEAATPTDPPLLNAGSGGSAAVRASSSSRCFLFRIAKSFKDILTFGVGSGGGVDAASGGDVGRGSSESGAARGGCGEEAGDDDSTRLFGGVCIRLRGSKDASDCGDGERMVRKGGYGVGAEL
jgi:hypothetical protein